MFQDIMKRSKGLLDMLKKSNKNKNIIESILSSFTTSALFLFIFVTLLIVLTSIIFICGGRVFKYLLLIVYALTVIGYLFVRRKNIRVAVIGVIIGTLVFAFTTFVSGYIYDTTPDGNTYHKLAVGAMKNGWNPVYDNVGDFDKDKGNPFDVLEDNVNIKWVNTYAKGSEIYGAVVYSFTGNIDSGKSFNMIFVFIGLFILFDILKKLKLNTWKALILSTIMALNPIALTQLTNYYLDGVLAMTLFTIILIVMNRELLKNNENYLILGLSIIWCCSVKFTGLAFAGVFCGIYYIYNSIMTYKYNKNGFKKFIFNDTIFYLIVVLTSVLIVGSSSYTRNFIKNGNPFYPLYGKGHVENMVLKEMPISMHKDNRAMIFIKGIFSKTENSSPSYSELNNQPDWKIPFTVTKEEMSNMVIPDIRIGGFGYFFGGVFILSIIGTVIWIIEHKKNKNYDEMLKNLLFIGITGVLVLALDGSYWARYIPYVFMFPVLTIYNLFKIDTKNKFINIYPYVIALVLLLNSLLILYTQMRFTYINNGDKRRLVNDFRYYASEHEEVEIKLEHHGIQGVQYNLDDLNISNYKLVEEDKKTMGYGFKY